MISKNDLRFSLRNVLRQLSPERRNQAATRLLAHLTEDKFFLSSVRVMLYYAMPTEVSTMGVLQRWENEKQLFLPALVEGHIQPKHYEGRAAMSQGAYDIWEPTTASLQDLSQLDYILVPGIGFDRQKNRLGHGKAYYDQFLAQPSLQQVHRVGVAFEEQIVEQLPTDPHDIPLHDLIIV